MPDEIDYDASRQRLLVGGGYVENVPPEVWGYEVLVCSPKTGPGGMRVSEALRGQETNHEATHG
jgi:hypothetical protein